VPVLRTNAATKESEVVYRCAAEPIEQYQRKGGDAKETIGRKCKFAPVAYETSTKRLFAVAQVILIASHIPT
jgi:hypothetical protein